MKIDGYFDFISKYEDSLSKYFSNQLDIPFSSESVWIVASTLLLLFFVLTGVVDKQFNIGKKWKNKFKIYTSLILMISCSLLLYHQYSSVINNLKTHEIIVTKFAINGSSESCGKFAKSLGSELNRKVAGKRTYYFEWPMEKYENSMVQKILKIGDSPIVIIGGSCETNHKYGQYSIEFKILKFINKVDLDKRLDGTFIKFPIDEIESFELQTKTADAIANSIKALDALLFECNGDCSRAIGVYTDLLNSVGKENKKLRAYIYERLSVVYFSLNNNDKAESVISQAIYEIPENEKLKISRGELYLIMNKPELAINDMISLKTTIKYQQDRLLIMSSAFGMQNKFKEAADLLNGKDKSELSDPKLIASVAYAAYKVEDNAKALELSNLALDRGPNDYDALVIGGMVRFQKGEKEESVKLYGKAINVDPNRKEAYEKNAISLVDIGQFGQALAMSEKSITLGSRDIQVMLSKAVALSRTTNNSNEVEQAFENANNLNPLDPMVYHQRGLYYARTGDYKNSIIDFKKAISIDSSFIPPYLFLAVVHIEKGNTKEAIKLLNQAKSKKDASRYEDEFVKIMNMIKK